MDEEYELKAGDPASYVAGPYAVQDPWDLCNADGTAAPNGINAIAGGSTLDCSNSSDPVYKVVGVGSNGFPGNSPQFTNVFQRNSFALYGELSGDVTDALFMQGAVRYENYDDFDSEVLFQLAGRLVLTDNWNARASIGTGFQSPNTRAARYRKRVNPLARWYPYRDRSVPCWWPRGTSTRRDPSEARKIK
jgi:iron complex outermembrane receptor protein